MPLPRLLLIDDEPALAAFVAKAADMCGFDPIIAEQDQQFRDKFRESRPHMVALDLGIPGMDGVELLRFLERGEDHEHHVKRTPEPNAGKALEGSADKDAHPAVEPTAERDVERTVEDIIEDATGK